MPARLRPARRRGLLTASGLVVTYRADGTRYEREVPGYQLGFDVTGSGTDSRDSLPVLVRRARSAG